MSFQLSGSNFTVLDGQDCIQVRVWFFTDKCNFYHEKYKWKLKLQICKNWRKPKSGLYTSKEKNLVQRVSSGYTEGFSLSKGVMETTWLQQGISFHFGSFKLFLYQKCRQLAMKVAKPRMYCSNVYAVKKTQAKTLLPFCHTLSALLKSCKDRVIWNMFHLQQNVPRENSEGISHISENFNDSSDLLFWHLQF